MPESELARRIRLGEDSTLELKNIRFSGNRITGPDRRDFADELAAMANGIGGTVVVGIDDKTRHVHGIPLDRIDIVEDWVREICADLIEPELHADLRRLELPDPDGQMVPIIRLDIPRSLFVHQGPHGYFRRSGSSKRKMTPDMLARLFQERSQSRVIHFDQSIVPGTSPEDLEYSLVRRFLAADDVRNSAEASRKAASEETMQTLRKLKILADDDGEPRLTLAGVLLCTTEPQRWLPYAYIQAVSYGGERTDIDYQTDARDICGPLDQQVAEALHFVRRNMTVRATKQQFRSEQPQFSERAVFEAVVNAVAHRDYSMAGMRIRLHMFADRLELYVPGALTNTLTPDSLHLRQSSRNELIVSLLARCPAPSDLGRTRMMDRRGDGVPIILDECRNLSGALPEYSIIDESELQLVMRAYGTAASEDRT